MIKIKKWILIVIIIIIKNSNNRIEFNIHALRKFLSYICRVIDKALTINSVSKMRTKVTSEHISSS